jgi:hypothetical protein
MDANGEDEWWSTAASSAASSYGNFPIRLLLHRLIRGPAPCLVSNWSLTYSTPTKMLGGLVLMPAIDVRWIWGLLMTFPIASRHMMVALLVAAASAFAGPKPPIPPSSTDVPLAAQPGKETAVFAGGCFWGVQSVFQRVKGVLSTAAGYSGGSAKTAAYKQVITETTGHAESVEVIYDPSHITYGQLLRIYFSVAHDPTQLNRQDRISEPHTDLQSFTRMKSKSGWRIRYRATQRPEGLSQANRDRGGAP